MVGMAGYTLLLAVPACLLVRFGGVWEDVRTVLLLVVLMFLATSVTFDETLARNPELGVACYLGGLLFAVAVSEGMLAGDAAGPAGVVPGAVLPDPGPVLPLPGGPRPAAGPAAGRGAAVGPVRVLAARPGWSS